MSDKSSWTILGSFFYFCFFCLFATLSGRMFMPYGSIILLDLILIMVGAAIWTFIALIPIAIIIGIVSSMLEDDD